MENLTDLTMTPTGPTEPLPVSQDLDILLGSVLVVCFVFGSTGNILALLYFSCCRPRRDLPTKIYLIMSSLDFLTDFSVFPMFVSYFNGRKPMLFGLPSLCKGWTILWQFLPYFSVFLVLVLSIVRTISLVSPFRRVSHKLTLGIIMAYACYLLLRTIIPSLISGLNYYAYRAESTQCDEIVVPDPTNWNYVKYKLYSNTFQLTIPFLPILMSSFISCWRVRRSQLKNRNNSNIQKRATITILTITFVYLIFNSPVFVWYCSYLLNYLYFKTWTVFTDNIMVHYGQSLVYVVGVALNAALNPVVYVSRIKKMRSFYRNSLRHKTRRALSRIFSRTNTNNINYNKRYSSSCGTLHENAKLNGLSTSPSRCHSNHTLHSSPGDTVNSSSYRPRSARLRLKGTSTNRLEGAYPSILEVACPDDIVTGNHCSTCIPESLTIENTHSIRTLSPNPFRGAPRDHDICQSSSFRFVDVDNEIDIRLTKSESHV